MDPATNVETDSLDCKMVMSFLAKESSVSIRSFFAKSYGNIQSIFFE